jgi:hypothetical protein
MLATLLPIAVSLVALSVALLAMVRPRIPRELFLDRLQVGHWPLFSIIEPGQVEVSRDGETAVVATVRNGPAEVLGVTPSEGNFSLSSSALTLHGDGCGIGIAASGIKLKDRKHKTLIIAGDVHHEPATV